MTTKRIFAALAAFVMLSVLLCGCGCRHDWQAANCNEPKRCKLCGETVGNRMGHHWSNATCTENKTCTRCGAIGEEAQGHKWVEATTEAPKTCRICAATEGERIITDERFHTADTKDFVGTWAGQLSVPCADLGYTGVNNPLVYNVELTFGKAGEFTSKVGLASGLPMKNEVIRLKAEEMYAFSASLGKDKAAADAEMQALLGMSVTQYATFLVQNFTFTDPVTSQITGVYYVQEGQVHAATKWTDDMTAEYGYIEEGELLWTAIGSGYSCTLTQVAG